LELNVRALLVNDDGYGEPGLAQCRELLEGAGFEVWSWTPDADRSGSSHMITWNRDVSVRQLAERQFLVAGTPVDCVTLALSYANQRGISFDRTFVGINRGLNFGATSVYSGTIAAAMEATLYDVPSVAVSWNPVLGAGGQIKAAVELFEHIERWIAHGGLPPRHMLNINILALPTTDVLIENLVADFGFRLPKARWGEGGGAMVARIAKTAEAQEPPFTASTLVGLLSRQSGYALEEAQLSSLRRLCVTLTG
jgi:5'-nucleotidase